VPEAGESEQKQPFSSRLRQIVENIDKLLKQYEVFKVGNQEKEPEITTATDPSILFPDPVDITKLTQLSGITEQKWEALKERGYETLFDIVNAEDGTLSKATGFDTDYIKILKQEARVLLNRFKELANPKFVNPTLRAVINLGELTAAEALHERASAKVRLLKSFGISPLLWSQCLIDWSSRLAGEFTYLLEAKTLYSEEIKAVYPELLVDLEEARGLADNLSRKLAHDGGYISLDDFHAQVGTLVHYAKIILQSAKHLADYHDEILSRGPPGLEGVGWVMEGEKPPKLKKPPEEKREEEEET